jgi:hypothetical protein
MRRRERIMKRFKSAGRRNGSCRFTVKSRTSFTSLIQNLQRLQPATLRVTAALLSGTRSPTQAPSPDAHLDQNSSPLARGSVNLTVPPVDDAFTAHGRVQANGRMVSDLYLFEVKKPSESKRDWDYYNLLATVPGDTAYPTAANSGCPLTK